MLKKILLLVRVSRPLSWPLTALLFGTGIVISNVEITYYAIINGLLASILLPLIVFGVNDVYDYKTDIINRRKRSAIHGMALESRHHRLVLGAALAATGTLAIFSAFTRNYTNIVATAVAILIAWAYSEPPLRLKEKPPLDSLSNAALVWSVILLGYSHGNSLVSLPVSVYFASLAAAAIHAMGAIMDYASDNRANVKTIATVFGKRLAATFSFAVVFAIILFSGIRSLSLRLFFFYAAAAFLVLLLRNDERLAKKLFMLGFLVALASLCLFIYQQFYK